MSFLGSRKLFPAALDTLSYSCFSKAFGINRFPASAGLIRGCSSSSSDIRDAPLSENDVVNPVFMTRNPRNLERLAVARKPSGWKFQYPCRTFYHRLCFDKSNRFLTGWVEHNSGKTILTASTKEFAISKHLYSTNDVSAALNVGRVLARRCLEAGIDCMHVLEPLAAEHSEKFQAFRGAMLEGGVDLTEPALVEPYYEPGIDYSEEWEMADLLRRQALVRKPYKQTMFRFGQRKHGIKVPKINH